MNIGYFEFIFINIVSFGFGILVGYIYTLKESINDITDYIKILEYDKLKKENKKLKEIIEIKKH